MNTETIIIEKANALDAFFVNLKHLCDIRSKDEKRAALMCVNVEEADITITDESGEKTVKGSVFVACDGKRQAMLQTAIAYTPGLYTVKSANSKLIILTPSTFTGKYHDWKQVCPSAIGALAVDIPQEYRGENNANALLFFVSRAGVWLDFEKVSALPPQPYTVMVYDASCPVMFVSGDFSEIIMPLGQTKVAHFDAKIALFNAEKGTQS